jgi:hypothetical protein
MDTCCTSADCANGARCYASLVITECSGGPAQPLYNTCVNDECATDADCAGKGSGQICAPAGAFDHPVRACLAAHCRTDADCTARPCGACVPVAQPCCAYPAGLACVYPGGCHDNADCGAGNTCEIDPKGEGVCVAGTTPCPV